jgi:hypothetical protein
MNSEKYLSAVSRLTLNTLAFPAPQPTNVPSDPCALFASQTVLANIGTRESASSTSAATDSANTMVKIGVSFQVFIACLASAFYSPRHH